MEVLGLVNIQTISLETNILSLYGYNCNGHQAAV